MPAQLAEFSRDGQGSKSFLPSKVARNASGLLLYRADYELVSMRKARRANNKVFRAFLAAKDPEVICALSRELDRWLDRERIILKIPQPASQQVQDGSKARRLAEPQRGLIVEEHPKPPVHVPVQADSIPVQPRNPIDVQSTKPV